MPIPRINISMPNLNGAVENVQKSLQNLSQGIIDPLQDILDRRKAAKVKERAEAIQNNDRALANGLQKIKTLAEFNRREQAGELDDSLIQKQVGLLYDRDAYQKNREQQKARLITQALDDASQVGLKTAGDAFDVSAGAQAVNKRLQELGVPGNEAMQLTSQWEKNADTLRNRFTKVQTDNSQALIDEIRQGPLPTNQTEIIQRINEFAPKYKDKGGINQKLVYDTLTGGIKDRRGDKADTRSDTQWGYTLNKLKQDDENRKMSLNPIQQAEYSSMADSLNAQYTQYQERQNNLLATEVTRVNKQIGLQPQRLQLVLDDAAKGVPVVQTILKGREETDWADRGKEIQDQYNRLTQPKLNGKDTIHPELNEVEARIVLSMAMDKIGATNKSWFNAGNDKQDLGLAVKSALAAFERNRSDLQRVSQLSADVAAEQAAVGEELNQYKRDYTIQTMKANSQNQKAEIPKAGFAWQKPGAVSPAITNYQTEKLQAATTNTGNKKGSSEDTTSPKPTSQPKSDRRSNIYVSPENKVHMNIREQVAADYKKAHPDFRIPYKAKASLQGKTGMAVTAELQRQQEAHVKKQAAMEKELKQLVTKALRKTDQTKQY